MPTVAPVDVLRLEVTAGPCAGAVFARPGELLTVGRTSKSKVHIKDAAVSEKHAALAWEGGRWVLRDVGSSNGTAVNGRRMREGAPTQPARHAQVQASRRSVASPCWRVSLPRYQALLARVS